MEGYVFAMMGNSGTDPDIEEEEERLRALREREVELRYLIQAGEDGGEEPGFSDNDTSDSPWRRLLKERDAQLQAEPSVLDHYSPCWAPGVKFPSPFETPPRFPPSPRSSRMELSGPASRISFGFLGDESESEDEFPASGVSRYLIKFSQPEPSQTNQQITRDLVRPAMFHQEGASFSCKNLPPLRMAYPHFPRIHLPVAPKQKATSDQAKSLLRRRQTAFLNISSKPPNWPTEKLMILSREALKQYYDSLSKNCYDINHT